MKAYLKYATILSLLIVLVIFNINSAHVQAFTSDISIDGYYDDWEGKPYSWEYVCNNPWQISNYWDPELQQNITKEYRDEYGNPYNIEIRHKMSLLSDGEYVYLYIKVSSNSGAGMYLDHFLFSVDGEDAAFRITYPNGDSLTKSNTPGIYPVVVRHTGSALSHSVVEGASAVYTRKPDGLNDEIEVKVPFSAMKMQNNNIDLDNIQTVEFRAPSMMYRKIACSGISTSPIFGIMSCAAVTGGAFVWRKRRNRSKAK